MAISAGVVAWGVWEFWNAYEASGQLKFAIDNLRWVCDYFLKAHVAEYEFYAQIGNGEIDHSLWAAPETQGPQLKREHGAEKYRPALKLTLENPGADLVGQTAAALAICSMIFEKNAASNPQDAVYAQELLVHAEQLFDFAYRSYMVGCSDPSGISLGACGSAGSAGSSSSSDSSSSDSTTGSGETCTEMCLWYGEKLRPLCESKETGWGWENNQVFIGRDACNNQWGDGGVVCK